MLLKTKYKTALTAIEKKALNHSKYITTPKFNSLKAQSFSARLAQENWASQNDIAKFCKKERFWWKIISNKKQHILAENNFKNLQTFDSSPFIGRCCSNIDVGQLYLIFQPLFYFVKWLGDIEKGCIMEIYRFVTKILLHLPPLVIVFLH